MCSAASNMIFAPAPEKNVACRCLRLSCHIHALLSNLRVNEESVDFSREWKYEESLFIYTMLSNIFRFTLNSEFTTNCKQYLSSCSAHMWSIALTSATNEWDPAHSLRYLSQKQHWILSWMIIHTHRINTRSAQSFLHQRTRMTSIWKYALHWKVH